jgi:glutathione S-transferase
MLEMNPAASGPILIDDAAQPVVGVLAVIHAIEERWSPSAVAGLFPAQPPTAPRCGGCSTGCC